MKVDIKKSEATKLVELVERVEEFLRRPVCARDINEFISKNEDMNIPCLIQSTGQNLLKLKFNRKLPRIEIIGRIKNRNYYSIGCGKRGSYDPNLAFKNYFDQIRANEAASLRMSYHVQMLIGTEHEQEARNAAAGFCEKFRSLTHHLPKLAEEVEILERLKADKYQPLAPSDFITRKEAKEMILSGLKEIIGEEVKNFHINKILASMKLNRPLFKEPVFLKKRIEVYIEIISNSSSDRLLNSYSIMLIF